jgi:hypothetical protein
MAGFFTYALNHRVLDWVFGGVAHRSLGVLYVGLSFTTSNRMGVVIEPSGGGYARVEVANNPASFPAAVSGTKTTANPIVFPAPTADWGTILSLFLADSPRGGIIMAMADLAAPRSIVGGSTSPTVAAGGLVISHS